MRLDATVSLYAAWSSVAEHALRAPTQASEEQVEAGGPGSGRHPEYGKFEQHSVKGEQHTYSSGKTSVMVFPHEGGKTEVYEQNEKPQGNARQRVGDSVARKIGQGTPEQAKGFLKSRYGIEHK